MNRTKILVLTVAMTLGISLKAHAFPVVTPGTNGNTVTNSGNSDPLLVIGNRVYDANNISSLLDSSTANSDFISYVSNNYNKIYYVQTSNGTTTIQDVFNNNSITEAQLIADVGNTLNYYTIANNQPSLSQTWVSQNGQYLGSTSGDTSNQYAALEISPATIGSGLTLFNFKVDQVVGVPGAVFYQIGSGNIMSLSSSASYMASSSSIVNGSLTIPITIYASDMQTLLASGNITVTSNGSLITAFQTQTVKFTNTPNNNITTPQSKYTVLGNVSNGGFIDCDSNYIYYINTADSNKIYKKNLYDTVDYPICDDKAGYLSVYGNWLYYCNYSDSGKLYKVQTDGTLRQKVSDNQAIYINAMNGTVYYVNGSDGGKIYSLDSAGNSTKLSDDQAAYLVLGISNGLYYSNLSQGQALYQISSTGIRSQVDNLGKINPASFVNMSINSSIAYYVSSDGQIYKSGDPYNPIKIMIQTSTGAVSDKISNFNISNNTIYYRSLTDGGKLYKVGASGGVSTKVVNSAVSNIFVYYDTTNLVDDLYYVTGGKMYMQVMDGVSKPVAIAKIANTNKVISTNPIQTIYANANDASKTISQVNILSYLPTEVSAVMQDGTIQQLPVSWNVSSPSGKNGVYTYNGTIIGYGTKVTANFCMATYDGLTLSEVTADNEPGANGTITINPGSLTPGDTVKVYFPSNSTKAVASATIGSNGGIVISGITFGPSAGTVNLTVTKPGNAESPALNVPYGPQRAAASNIYGASFANTGISYANNGLTTQIVGPNGSTISGGLTINLDNTDEIYYGTCTTPVTAENDSANWVSVAQAYSNKGWLGSGTWAQGTGTTGTLTLNGIQVPSTALQTGGSGQQIFIRAAANGSTPASLPATFTINPRVPVPPSIVFNPSLGTITGTTTTEEYSTDGINWTTCSAQSTNISYPTNNNPVRVRLKATQANLPGQEIVQVLVTGIDSQGNPQTTNLAITQPAQVIATTGVINNISNIISLKASVPVTWSVVDSSGKATSKASVQSTSSTTATLTGYENGVYTVKATSTDGNNSLGSVNVNVTNQPVVTVGTNTELQNAVSSGAEVIKLMGLGGIYNLASLPTLPPTSTNPNGDLTIIGQGATSVVNVTTTAATGGIFATVGGSNNTLQHLNLQNLALVGASGNSLTNVIQVTGHGTLTMNGVSLQSLNANVAGNTTAGIYQDSTGASNVSITNSQFKASNQFATAVLLNSGSITNSVFNGNPSFTGEKGAVNAFGTVGTVTIEGNTFTNYVQSNDYAIYVQSEPNISNTGGVGVNLWNIISNCTVGIDAPGINAPNANPSDKSNLLIHNSIDIKSVPTQISTN